MLKTYLKLWSLVLFIGSAALASDSYSNNLKSPGFEAEDLVQILSINDKSKLISYLKGKDTAEQLNQFEFKFTPYGKELLYKENIEKVKLLLLKDHTSVYLQDNQYSALTEVFDEFKEKSLKKKKRTAFLINFFRYIRIFYFYENQFNPFYKGKLSVSDYFLSFIADYDHNFMEVGMSEDIHQKLFIELVHTVYALSKSYGDVELYYESNEEPKIPFVYMLGSNLPLWLPNYWQKIQNHFESTEDQKINSWIEALQGCYEFKSLQEAKSAIELKSKMSQHKDAHLQYSIIYANLGVDRKDYKPVFQFRNFENGFDFEQHINIVSQGFILMMSDPEQSLESIKIELSVYDYYFSILLDILSAKFVTSLDSNKLVEFNLNSRKLILEKYSRELFPLSKNFLQNFANRIDVANKNDLETYYWIFLNSFRMYNHMVKYDKFVNEQSQLALDLFFLEIGLNPPVRILLSYQKIYLKHLMQEYERVITKVQNSSINVNSFFNALSSANLNYIGDKTKPLEKMFLNLLELEKKYSNISNPLKALFEKVCYENGSFCKKLRDNAYDFQKYLLDQEFNIQSEDGEFQQHNKTYSSNTGHQFSIQGSCSLDLANEYREQLEKAHEEFVNIFNIRVDRSDQRDFVIYLFDSHENYCRWSIETKNYLYGDSIKKTIGHYNSKKKLAGACIHFNESENQNEVVAHEYIHDLFNRYIGKRFHFVETSEGKPRRKSSRLVWFEEGVADYISYKVAKIPKKKYCYGEFEKIQDILSAQDSLQFQYKNYHLLVKFLLEKEINQNEADSIKKWHTQDFYNGFDLLDFKETLINRQEVYEDLMLYGEESFCQLSRPNDESD